MKIKSLTAVLLMIVGFSLAGYMMQFMAVTNVLRHYNEAMLAMYYLLFFVGLGLLVLGGVLFCKKGKCLEIIIPAVAVAALGIIFIIATLGLGTHSILQYNNYVLFLFLITKIAIITLGIVSLFVKGEEEEQVVQAGNQQQPKNERLEAVKMLKAEGVIDEEEYRKRVLESL